MSSGYAALIAAVYLGRSIRHPADMEGGMFTEIKEPANVPIVMLGTALLWMGWFGVSNNSFTRVHEIPRVFYIHATAKSQPFRKE
jgi:Amt family ammonium transporter